MKGLGWWWRRREERRLGRLVLRLGLEGVLADAVAAGEYAAVVAARQYVAWAGLQSLASPPSSTDGLEPEGLLLSVADGFSTEGEVPLDEHVADQGHGGPLVEAVPVAEEGASVPEPVGRAAALLARMREPPPPANGLVDVLARLGG